MARLRRRNHRVPSRHNEILQAWAMTLVLFAVAIGLFGFAIFPYLVLQAAIAIIMLENVNYIEHYGLCRAKRPDGRYDPIRPEHSWNSDQRVSNLMMFQVQRHSDHHAHPGRRYQTLRTPRRSTAIPVWLRTDAAAVDDTVLAARHGTARRRLLQRRRHLRQHRTTTTRQNDRPLRRSATSPQARRDTRSGADIGRLCGLSPKPAGVQAISPIW